MNRYAPELALVAGGLLGVVFGGFALFSVGEFYSAALVAALCCYPFGAYAIHTDEDPTTVLPPRVIVAVAGVVAVGVVVDVLRLSSASAGSLLFGLAVGLVVFLPAAAYATAYGDPPAWLAPRPVEIGATVLAFALLAGGIASGAAASGSVSALLVFVAGTTFAARSTGVDPRRRRRLPVAGLLLAAVLLIVGVARGGPLDPWVLASLAAVCGPLGYVSLTASSRI
ncbi:MAG: hypothetical protein ACOC0Z_04125 [Halohasta sp.]